MHLDQLVTRGLPRDTRVKIHVTARGMSFRLTQVAYARRGQLTRYSFSLQA